MADVRTIDPNTALVTHNLTDPHREMGLPETGTHATTAAQADVPPGEHHADPTALGLNATAWVALSMLVVIGILLWKKVPAAIGRALDKKIAAIREQLDEAARLRADAEALKAEYEAKAAAAGAEAEAMIERARSEADSILRQAETDAAALVERRGRIAEDKIAAAERAALDQVRAQAAAAAAAAAERLIRERHDAGADRAMVDQAIAGLGRAH
ncbi:MAG: F0F1 ATP synthase subunit B [Allosphingosinicella sp.]|uniref:F0F1 ATP synthase subunit B family protein n=1 Tax=Allosphingosinicella sp. TaxID=2823234 RepID=UPI00392745BD